MSERAVLQVGAVAVFYLLWVISWLVLGHDASGSVSRNWVQALVAVAAAVAALNAVRRAAPPYRLFLVMAAAGILLLAGCGGGSDTNSDPALKVRLTTSIGVPNINDGSNFSFDIAAVDSSKGRMYFTDRNNKAIDVVDVTVIVGKDFRT